MLVARPERKWLRQERFVTCSASGRCSSLCCQTRKKLCAGARRWRHQKCAMKQKQQALWKWYTQQQQHTESHKGNGTKIR